MAATVDDAIRSLESGGLVVYPTDTLVGLGARATDRRAVGRLVAVKARPDGLPISVAVSSYEEIEPWVRWGPATRAVARRLLPGPYTLLLPGSRAAVRDLAPGILGPDRSLGVRIPDHPLARALAEAVGPLTCTSANRHGAPPALTIQDAMGQLKDEVDVYVDGPPAPSGRPSAVVDLRGAKVRVIPRS